jgi:hypothetical protein
MNYMTSVSLPIAFASGFPGYVPEPTILPGNRGVIAASDISNNDVLSGRGRPLNEHVGNFQFRKIVNQAMPKYFDPSNKTIEKSYFAARVVAIVRCLNPPGRFLKEVKGTGYWEEIGDVEARKKASQALREKIWEKTSVNKAEKGGSTKLNLTTNQTHQHAKAVTVDSIQTAAEANSEMVLTPNLRHASCPSMSTIEIMESICYYTDNITSDLFLSGASPVSRMSSLDFTESFLLNDQDMTAVGPVSCSELLTYCIQSTVPLGLDAFSSDLMSDNLDFEIAIPGIGEDTFINFPCECPYQGDFLYQRQTSAAMNPRVSSLSTTEHIKRICSDDTFSCQMSLDPRELIRLTSIF